MKKMNYKTKILTAAVLFFWGIGAYSQQVSSPIEAYEPPEPKEFGIVIGFGANWQTGMTYAECNDCGYDNGSKFGYTLGLVYERQAFSTNTKFGIMGLYDNQSLYSSFKRRESFEFEPNRFVPVNFRYHNDLDVSALSLVPYFKWSPAKFFFIKAGPSLSYLVNANIKNRKEVLDKTTLLPTGETVSIGFTETKRNEITLEDREYPEVNKIQAAISLMTGFNFEFGYDFTFAPYFMYNIPITTFSDYKGNADTEIFPNSGESLKINTWRILFEFRMKF